MKQQTRLDYLSQPGQPFSRQSQPINRLITPRMKTFMLVFLLSLLVGLIINYSRPAIYQSQATLLTSAATAVDQSSSEVDFQHVTIQKQKLLGYELLSETLSRIKGLTKNWKMSTLTLPSIRNMLEVEAIEETNLLSMSAEGEDPDILPVVINTWIDVYLDARALSVKNSAENTVELVKNELSELQVKTELARKELDEFRKKHNISSIVREENESPAILTGLTKSLNDANEEVVKAKARLDAVNLAIANGQAVVPDLDQITLSDLERRHQELTEKLAEFDKRFTRDYLELQPALKFIPEQIKELESEIKKQRKLGKNIVWTQANQEYNAAKQVVAEIREQLNEHKNNASNFTTLFSRHQKLIDDLESLELINRETRERLAKIESKQFEKYPQVDVVERASINRQAISPDYNKGGLIVLLSSLLLAFFAVWFREFLMRDHIKQEYADFSVPAWFGFSRENDLIEQERSNNIIEQYNRNGLLYKPEYKKIPNEDLDTLLNKTDIKTQQLILLLLSGLTIEEIADLKIQEIIVSDSVIQLSGDSPRTLPLGERLQKTLNDSIETGFLWGLQARISEEGLTAMLYCSVVDIGLKDMDEIIADSIRQTYIIYLVEQGIRLTMLDKIVGYLSPLEQAGYADFSPSGEGCDIGQIELIHPACR